MSHNLQEMTVTTAYCSCGQKMRAFRSKRLSTDEKLTDAALDLFNAHVEAMKDSGR